MYLVPWTLREGGLLLVMPLVVSTALVSCRCQYPSRLFRHRCLAFSAVLIDFAAVEDLFRLRYLSVVINDLSNFKFTKVSER